MGRLSNEHKLTARTAPEVVESVNVLIARLQRAGFKFRMPDGKPRKISIEGLIGSVLMHFLNMPEDAQDQIVRAYVPRLEAVLKGEPLPELPAQLPAVGRQPPRDTGRGAASQARRVEPPRKKRGAG